MKLIANHTYDHSYLPGKSFNYQKWQLETTQKAIKKCLGINYNALWFRAPYGAQDSNTIKAARSLGLNTALWTIDLLVRFVKRRFDRKHRYKMLLLVRLKSILFAKLKAAKNAIVGCENCVYS